MRNKRNATITAIVGTVVLVVGLWLIIRNIGVPGLPLNTLAPFGQQAWDIQNLNYWVFGVAGLIFVAVEVGILWMVARFRRNKDDVDGEGEPVQLHGNTPLEIGWTIAPALLLAVLAVFNVQTILALDDSSTDAIEVTVIGQQWWWEYRYDTNADGTPDIITATQIVIPVGRDVNFKIQSNDVIHSFWIPALNGKKDAVPGRTHGLVITAEQPGIYEGQCTEYCGLSHGVMRMQVKALPQAEYDKWVTAMTTPPESPESELAKAGEALFVGQCARCHEVNGLNPDSKEPFTYAELPSPNYGKDVNSSLSSKQRAQPDPPDDAPDLRRQPPGPVRGQGVHRGGGGAGRRTEHQQPQALAAEPGGGQADGSAEQPGHAQPPALGAADRPARRLPGDTQVTAGPRTEKERTHGTDRGAPTARAHHG